MLFRSIMDIQPDIVFFIEILLINSKLNNLKKALGFDFCFGVECRGHSSGIALLWKKDQHVNLLGFNNHFIDVQLTMGGTMWSFTGYYGHANRSERHLSWNLIKLLAKKSSLPWLIMGDFNDMLKVEEKKGGLPQLARLLNGFRNVIIAVGLFYMGLIGHQFT